MRLLFFLLLVSSPTYAQSSKLKFGGITTADFSKNVFEIDTSAAAVILYDHGNTYFTYEDNIGFVINTEYHIRKRILTNEATSLGILDIVYYVNQHSSSQNIYDLKARTYWLENGLVKSSEVTSKDIFDTKVEDKFYNKKITFPNVKAGCIIEYSYTLRSPMSVRDKPYSWYFQGKYPVLYSEYNIGIPTFLGYSMIMSGYLSLDKNTQEEQDLILGHSNYNGKGVQHKYVLSNIPPFKDEPFIASKEDYISKISFELNSVWLPGKNLEKYSTNWKAINSTLLDSEAFGKIILRKTGYLKDLVKQLGPVKDKKEKLKEVYNKLNGSFEIDTKQWSVFLQDEQKKVLDNKKGTANQVNSLFISLLKELNYDVTPVILSRRKNGFINESYPLLDKFDYIIGKVNIDGETYFLDITDKSLPLGILPFQCLNRKGFEIKQSGGEFVEIIPKAKYWSTVKVETELDLAKGFTKGKVESSNIGYRGQGLREEYFEKGDKFQTEYTNKLIGQEISNFEIINVGANTMPLIIKYSFNTEEDDFIDADFIYFNPFLTFREEKNPFTLEERQYPVDLGVAHEYIFSNTIKVPSGYAIETLPKSEAISLPDKSATYSCQFLLNEAKDTISVISRLSLKQPLYYSDSYHNLKELFSFMVKKNNEQIVLKKK